MSKEKRNDPTAADGDVMDALQQIDADVDKAIAAQKTDPDRKTDPDDAPVNDALKALKSDVQNAILAQSKDGAADARARALVHEVRAGSARVVSEPRVYSELSPHSFYRDLASYQLKFVPEHDQALAKERLMRHGSEVIADMRAGNTYATRALIEVMRGGEQRAVSTASTSDGVFVTPQYLIDKWITYRSPDRTFTNQCTPLPLPTYGTQINVPAFTNYGAAGQQITENTGSTSTSPSGGDREVTLATFSGYIDISQQLFDRGGFQGQGGSMDVIIIKQSQDQLYAAVDTYMQQQALTNAGAVITNSLVASNLVEQFYLDFGAARNLLSDTLGVRLPGTHLFSASDFFGYISSQVDSSGRPIMNSVPDAAALAMVAMNQEQEPSWSGWTGIYMPGNYLWFLDDNTTTVVAPSTEYTILVGSPLDMLMWIGDMVPFTAQQTHANELTVLCGLRQYAAAIPRHTEAFSYITGSVYATSNV